MGRPPHGRDKTERDGGREDVVRHPPVLAAVHESKGGTGREKGNRMKGQVFCCVSVTGSVAGLLTI